MSATEAAPEAKPSRSGRLLALVRALIAYGRQVATTLGTTHPTLSPSDITLILRRIARGLLRAEALEAKITRDAARLDAEPKPGRARAQSQGRARERPARAATSRPADMPDSLLAALPTAEQIAAEVRRRPIGAVIADICRDIGIIPSNKLWPEIRNFISRYRGNLARLVKDILDRMFFQHPALAWPDNPLPADALRSPALPGTGPPG